MAAIITIHRPRNGGSARPIVPGPSPMLRARVMVKTQAAAATIAAVVHGTTSRRGGMSRAGRAAAARAPAWPVMTATRQPSYRKSVTKLFVPVNSALQWPR